jgi:hypothetical protein
MRLRFYADRIPSPAHRPVDFDFSAWFDSAMKPKDMPWGTYIRIGTGRRLSNLGELLGIHWLTYNPIHFKHFHDNAVSNAKPVIATMRQVFPGLQRWIDVGAGSGAFAAEAKSAGLQVVACEHNKAGRKMGLRDGVDMREFDLTRDPPSDINETFDLAYSFEVAEHLPEALGVRLVEFLAEKAPTVVFTAAHPGQGGTGHINEQSKQYWIEKFAQVGMSLDEMKTEQLVEGFRTSKVPANWFIANALVFNRSAR